MLARPELEQLAQRVIARYHLDALSEPRPRSTSPTGWPWPGWPAPCPSTPMALKRIHRLARGVPRRINLLAGRALLGAWATGQRAADGRRRGRRPGALALAGGIAGPAGGRRSGRAAGVAGRRAEAGRCTGSWRGAGGFGRGERGARGERGERGARGECRECGGVCCVGAEGCGADCGGFGSSVGAGCSGFGIRARFDTHGGGVGRGGSLCRQRARRFRLDERPAARPGYRLAATRAGLATASGRRPLPRARREPGAVLPRRQPEPAADPPTRPARHPDAAAGRRASRSMWC
jgi:hypothetical protein